ncbi:response regulator [Candidatus Albibeggiatoa sp. nov. NOAA]|uniref:hybrid sensor histidine kinase/response regulator n=1 Tax=Candidatus Albibeggiatoa sp. nov. NOAA TaxID=3162724 RepID=UPI0032FBD61F|nr:response regulator [Thiotrichaceae bacterium]
MLESLLAALFSSGQYMPHGYCFQWDENLVRLHVISDAAIGIAYFSIPFMLLYLTIKRNDLPFKGIFLLFSLVIISCGASHLLSILTLYEPYYWIEGIVKVITAIISVIMAILLVFLIPKALSLPSPQQLREYNSTLESVVAERTEALRSSEERFELAMQGASDGLWDWNIQDNTMYYSPRWKSMLGYQQDELSDEIMDWRQFIHPDDMADFTKRIDDYLNKQTPTYESLYQMKHKHGHYIWILSRGVAVWNNEGKPIRFVGTHMDMTGQKQVETELRTAKDIAEKAKVQAEVANQAKSTFLANMSHELRTPLNGILGYAQILQRDHSLNAKQAEGINVIQRSGDYLLTLINDILDLAKIEAGKIELYPTDFDLTYFIQNLNEVFMMRAKQKGIAFNYEQLSHLPAGIHADEKRLRQVLMNLIGNAIKFTDQGGVTFTSTYKNNQLQFQIVDTGIGIEQYRLDEIFKPFEQAGDINQKAEGTGLGLTITRNLTEMLQGELRVTSTPNQGSIFTITIPVQETTVAVMKAKTPVVVKGYQHTKNISKPFSILIVDDKPENISVLQNLLEPLQFTVVAANNGQAAWEAMEKQAFDLLITDLVMPVMDGFELARRIRKHPEWNQVPIIAASASVFDYQQSESLEAGCNTFLPKPIHLEELLQAIHDYLPLEWVCEQEDTRSQLDEPIQPIDDALSHTEAQIELRTEYASKLFELGMMGDIGELNQYLDGLHSEGELATPLFKQLKDLTAQFDSDEICEIVKPYMAVS